MGNHVIADDNLGAVDWYSDVPKIFADKGFIEPFSVVCGSLRGSVVNNIFFCFSSVRLAPCTLHRHLISTNATN
jgi:hypothetical protein